MATTHPYAFNTGSTISGTTQVGNIAIGTTNQDYSTNPGGVTWYMGPDEDLGYVITSPDDNPSSVSGFIFHRTSGYTDDSIIASINEIAGMNAHPSFSGLTEAVDWSFFNGHPLMPPFINPLLSENKDAILLTEDKNFYLKYE